MFHALTLLQSILFMDEPTSGLDTAGALLVARIARKIAKSGVVVICTIHQPSRMVFETFDYLLLMKRGGNTVYFGEIGRASRELVRSTTPVFNQGNLL